MRSRSVTTLTLGAVLAVAPIKAMAVEADEPGYLVARGSFDPAALCASLGPSCSVIQNEVVLAADQSLDRGFHELHGAATYVVRWKEANHSHCDPWTLTVWIELTGAGNTDLEAIGALVTHSDSEIFFGKSCEHKILQGQSAGDWAAKLAPGQQVTGRTELSEQNVAMEIVDFTLDWAVQAEAPEGFFTQDYDSAAAAAFLADDTFLILHPELTEGMFEDGLGVVAVDSTPDATQQAEASTVSIRHTRPFDDPAVNAFFFYFLMLTDHIVLNPLGVPVLDFTLDQHDSDAISDEAFETFVELVGEAILAASPAPDEP